ncbi:CbtB-domain containing protein [Nocardia cyriacigeorgica]|uniref:CbtB-domain containing protein n=1 Tax=Nocardia cyriacigeorgica TaxID=135487 RepID=A0A6P1D2R2_9NOCA|nr:CbtB-domain containing protein [Nocardia cyriacigeorgica]NEW42083.1 CbtB-domain containing protein [Nocardia cyriacigeorgica]NEW44875.1 CbtB-domain containing protein [Nocardia cyriacigeorgica]NEW53111.1 CbtB-domain containing protein [Nocardia cyriacigeorgica]NEW57156.1 CbtB-domain containing protein [Nocardia cyriacigeorgica]
MAIVHSPGASARITDSLATVLITVGVVLLALLTLYLVGFDQGAISRSGMYMHELMHDGRHLLGLPCH